jgi:hypothetical protein
VVLPSTTSVATGLRHRLSLRHSILDEFSADIPRDAFDRRVALAVGILILIAGMRKYIRNSPYMLPVTMVMLTAASWETIARRSLLMAQGACTTAEYWRMGEEKAAAMRSPPGWSNATTPQLDQMDVQYREGAQEACPCMLIVTLSKSHNPAFAAACDLIAGSEVLSS